MEDVQVVVLQSSKLQSGVLSAAEFAAGTAVAEV
jgi:hypothetical protein